MPKTPDYPVDAWGNCTECGGGPEGSIPHDQKCSHFDPADPANFPYGWPYPFPYGSKEGSSDD